MLDDSGLLKHFKPALAFPARHVFWDNVKDPDSITHRWEELRCYYERLLNQPEVLACPMLYDELGLSESKLLNACLEPVEERKAQKERRRSRQERDTRQQKQSHISEQQNAQGQLTKGIGSATQAIARVQASTAADADRAPDGPLLAARLKFGSEWQSLTIEQKEAALRESVGSTGPTN